MSIGLQMVVDRLKITWNFTKCEIIFISMKKSSTLDRNSLSSERRREKKHHFRLIEIILAELLTFDCIFHVWFSEIKEKSIWLLSLIQKSYADHICPVEVRLEVSTKIWHKKMNKNIESFCFNKKKENSKRIWSCCTMAGTGQEDGFWDKTLVNVLKKRRTEQKTKKTPQNDFFNLFFSCDEYRFRRYDKNALDYMIK